MNELVRQILDFFASKETREEFEVWLRKEAEKE